MLKEIEELLRFGYNISFTRELNQIGIEVSKIIPNIKHGETKVNTKAVLPFDHLYESKIIGCIKYLHEETTKKVRKLID